MADYLTGARCFEASIKPAGWAILRNHQDWYNTSFTRFGDLRPFVPIPATELFDVNGKQGGLTVAPTDGSKPPRQTADISLQGHLSHSVSNPRDTAVGLRRLRRQSFDRLRYALLPYIYSLAGWTTQRGYSMFRPLVMDFPRDRTARELNDEYMFGPALLVAPVTKYRQRARTVYLPVGAKWNDYWTGRPAGSGDISAMAPYDQIPLFVRAGSIIPYGPPMQYVAQKPSDPTTLYVYAGADGHFTLYEDQGTTFDYEKGAFSRIPISWDEKTTTLTIGARVGGFDGMLLQRTFQIVLVSATHPVGFPFTHAPLRSVQYTGAKAQLKLQ